MSFISIYFFAFLIIMVMMTTLWIASVYLKNVSIVDVFWGVGFVISAFVYFVFTNDFGIRKILILCLTIIWGLRLSLYIAWRNRGKGEDFRYREFRHQYGEERYWYVSFFQTFLLQGVLMWLISAPLLGAQFEPNHQELSIMDGIAFLVWMIGFTFEAGGDWQLTVFKSNPENKGKVLNSGFWRYTRHPNYFGDAAVWWGFGLFSVSAGNYYSVLGSLLMTALIIKVSGVALLEKSLKTNKPEYNDYIRKTPAFFPWFPKNI